MPYTKTNWVDRVVQYPNRFTRTEAGGFDTLIPAPGTVTQAGTPINAAALNNIEKQYDAVMADLNAGKGLLFGQCEGLSLNSDFIAGIPLVAHVSEISTHLFSMNNSIDTSRFSFLKGGIYQIHIEMARTDLLSRQSWYIGYALNDLQSTIAKAEIKAGDFNWNWSSPPNASKVPLQMTHIRRISAGDYLRFLMGSDDGPRSYMDIKFYIMRVGD
ncbi:hypothetical protein [Bacillus sp. FJAT-29814]|uniref:hypothetical protein n=1 Tax=Bacillus sp. FJAT-29814 TaxID=1729688 RepID=UPI00082AFC8E|nr:hypothetical protein [Bacillus sp. FJAT-29814]